MLVAKYIISVAKRSFGKAYGFLGKFQEIFQKFLTHAHQKNSFEFSNFGDPKYVLWHFRGAKMHYKSLPVNLRKFFKKFWRPLATKIFSNFGALSSKVCESKEFFQKFLERASQKNMFANLTPLSSMVCLVILFWTTW